MAEYRAKIFGTELDSDNCSFFLKTGVCRYGSRCQRTHVVPTFSQTVLLKNFYLNPCHLYESDGTVVPFVKDVSDDEVQEHFDNFFEDVYVECEEKYGKVVSMIVCNNISQHMGGNVYVKFKSERSAKYAVFDLNGRWFGGKPIYAELTPVTDFYRGKCTEYAENKCPRGGDCNFMHVIKLSEGLRQLLFGSKRVMRGKPWNTLLKRHNFPVLSEPSRRGFPSIERRNSIKKKSRSSSSERGRSSRRRKSSSRSPTPSKKRDSHRRKSRSSSRRR